MVMAGLGNTSVSKSREKDAQREGGTERGGGFDEISVEGADECLTFMLVNVMFNPPTCMFCYTRLSSALFISSFPYSHLVYGLFHQCIYVAPFYVLLNLDILISQSINSAHSSK